MSSLSPSRSKDALRLSAALVTAVSAAMLIACSHSAPVGNAPHPDPDSPDAIIAHYYRAIGGHDHLESITSRHMWGVYSEGKFSATTDMAWKRPAWRA